MSSSLKFHKVTNVNLAIENIENHQALSASLTHRNKQGPIPIRRRL